MAIYSNQIIDMLSWLGETCPNSKYASNEKIYELMGLDRDQGRRAHNKKMDGFAGFPLDYRFDEGIANALLEIAGTFNCPEEFAYALDAYLEEKEMTIEGLDDAAKSFKKCAWAYNELTGKERIIGKARKTQRSEDEADGKSVGEELFKEKIVDPILNQCLRHLSPEERNKRQDKKLGMVTGGGAHSGCAGESAATGLPKLVLTIGIYDEGRQDVVKPKEVVISPLKDGVIGIGHCFEAGTRAVPFGEGTDSRRWSVPFEGREYNAVRGVFAFPKRKAGGVNKDGEKISDDPVSRYHCVLVYSERKRLWQLFDLETSNGTLVKRTDEVGSEFFLIAGLGANNKNAVYEVVGVPAGKIPLEVIAERTGAGIGDDAADFASCGVPVREGDEICLGFRIVENGDGSLGFGPRNKACIVKIAELV